MPWDDRTKRRLKLRDLDILLAVVETGSMGKAAKRLNTSQPAVSKAVVELEDALGVRLVDRSRRGVVPTPYGLALAQQDFERILGGWITELGVTVHREVEFTGLAQGPGDVGLELSNGDRIEAQYVIPFVGIVVVGALLGSFFGKVLQFDLADRAPEERAFLSDSNAAAPTAQPHL